jgi:hypothetical protein
MAINPQSIVPSAKYIAIFDSEGNCKILERPTQKSVLGFDGTDAYWMDGGTQKPLMLPNIQTDNMPLAYIMGISSAGRLMAFRGLSDKKRFLASTLIGTVEWEDLIGVPDGPGLPFRPNYVQDGITPVPDVLMLTDTGLIYIDASGDVTAIPNATNGYQLTMVSGVPTWKAPFSGSVSAGGNAVGFGGITGSSTSNSAVNVKAPQLTLTDSMGATVTVTAVNVSASLTASLGIGGLDIGAEAGNTWYYLYVVSDGTNSNAVISLSPTAPDLTNLGAYTFHFLASVFRNNNASNIVQYVQRGPDFWTAPQVMTEPGAITTAYAAIPQTTALNTIVPPLVKCVSGMIGGSQAAGVAIGIYSWIASDANGMAVQGAAGAISGSWEGFFFTLFSFNRLPILDPSSPVLYWRGHTANTKQRCVITHYGI